MTLIFIFVDTFSIVLTPRKLAVSCSTLNVLAGENHRQVARAGVLASGPGHSARVLQAEVRNTLQPLLDGYAHFHPRQVGTGAAVDADAEGDVRVVLSVEYDLVRVLELGRVAVGGREVHQDAVVLLHRAAAVLDVAVRHAGHSYRRVGTQQLLDGVLDDLRPLYQRLAV